MAPLVPVNRSPGLAPAGKSRLTMIDLRSKFLDRVDEREYDGAHSKARVLALYHALRKDRLHRIRVEPKALNICGQPVDPVVEELDGLELADRLEARAIRLDVLLQSGIRGVDP